MDVGQAGNNRGKFPPLQLISVSICSLSLFLLFYFNHFFTTASRHKFTLQLHSEVLCTILSSFVKIVMSQCWMPKIILYIQLWYQYKWFHSKYSIFSKVFLWCVAKDTKQKRLLCHSVNYIVSFLQRKKAFPGLSSFFLE